MNKAKIAMVRIVLLAIVFSTVVTISNAYASEAQLECHNCNLDATEMQIFTEVLAPMLKAKGINPSTSTIRFHLSDSTYLGHDAVKMKFFAVSESGKFFTGYSTQYINLADDKISMAISAVNHALK